MRHFLLDGLRVANFESSRFPDETFEKVLNWVHFLSLPKKGTPTLKLLFLVELVSWSLEEKNQSEVRILVSEIRAYDATNFLHFHKTARQH